jgi:hypothetical protein
MAGSLTQKAAHTSRTWQRAPLSTSLETACSRGVISGCLDRPSTAKELQS